MRGAGNQGAKSRKGDWEQPSDTETSSHGFVTEMETPGYCPTSGLWGRGAHCVSDHTEVSFAGAAWEMEQHKKVGHHCEAACGPPAGERSCSSPPEVCSLWAWTAAVLGEIPQRSSLQVWTQVATAASFPLNMAVFESLMIFPLNLCVLLAGGGWLSLLPHLGPLVTTRCWCGQSPTMVHVRWPKIVQILCLKKKI